MSLDNATFDRFVTAVFGPGPSAGRHRDVGSLLDGRDHLSVVDCYARLFGAAGLLLRPYTDPQVAGGIAFLIDPGCSDYPFALKDAEVPLEERVRCVDALELLFRDVFAARSSPELPREGTGARAAIDQACFMFFDRLPLHGEPPDPPLDTAMLALLGRLLKIEHRAVRESALHGLGHWALAYPPEVEAIVDRFLAEATSIDPALSRYARDAAAGAVE